LGLNTTISNRPYEVTAEMMEPGHAEYGELALRVAEQLSRKYYAAYEETRTLGLTSSPSEKFAKLLLSWSPNGGNANKP
jgi:hypothetical protein